MSPATWWGYKGQTCDGCSDNSILTTIMSSLMPLLRIAKSTSAIAPRLSKKRKGESEYKWSKNIINLGGGGGGGGADISDKLKVNLFDLQRQGGPPTLKKKRREDTTLSPISP